MNVDGSSTPVLFKYTPTVATWGTRVLFLIIDGSITVAKFGGINGGLTNGLEVGFLGYAR